jgi:hypothetical protein
MTYWLVTAEEGDYTMKRLFATQQEACMCAWRWEDDLLDNIQMEKIEHPSPWDNVPF